MKCTEEINWLHYADFACKINISVVFSVREFIVTAGGRLTGKDSI